MIQVSPVNDPPAFTSGGNVTVNEDSGAYSRGWATAISPGPGESGQTVTFNVSNNNNALFSSQPVISSSGILSFTPAATAYGTAVVTISARDNGGTANGGVNTSASQTFNIVINNVNHAPSFTTGGNVSVNEDSGAYSARWATAVSAGAGESGQTVSFNVSNNNNSLFSAQPAVSPAGDLTFTPAANASGSATVTIFASDNGGTANGGVDTSAPQTFTITVNAVNDPPSFTSGGNVTVNEDSGAYSAAWATSISAGPPDETGQSVTFNATNNNNALFLSSAQPAIDGAGNLTFTPAANAFGTATVTVTASDGTASSAAQTFDIRINAVNDRPTFTAGPNNTVDEDAGPQTVNPWATAISPGPGESGQILTFHVTGNTNPSLFSAGPSISSNGVLTYTSAPNANGTAAITITVSDNGGTGNGGTDTSAPQTFNIAVNPVNDPPVGGADSAQTVGNVQLFYDIMPGAGVVGTTKTTASAKGVLDNDSDPEGDTVSVFGVVGCGDNTSPLVCPTANGGEISLDSNGSFTFRPTRGSTTADSFQYILTDGFSFVNVTVDLTFVASRIWFVKNNGAGGSGRSNDPFQTLAEAQAAANAANDRVFVYAGDGTTNGQNGGFTFQANNQTLQGEAVALTTGMTVNGVDDATLVAAGARPLIGNDGGNGVTFTNRIGTTVTGLSIAGSAKAIEMTTSAAAAGTYSISNNIIRSAGAEGIDVEILSGTTGTVTLAIINNTWDTGGTHTGRAIDIQNSATFVNLNLSGNTNILSTGTTGISISGGSPPLATITGFAGNSVHGNTVGTGVFIQNVTFDQTPGGTFQQVDGDNLAVGAPGNPVGGYGFRVLGSRGNLFFDDLDVFAATGIALDLAGGAGGLTFAVTPAAPDGAGTSTLDDDAGPAVYVSNASIDLRLAALESTILTSVAGVNLDTVGGTFRAPAGSTITKSDGGGAAFSVTSSATGASVTYDGTLNVTSGAGVSLSNNTGATISFGGTMTLSTGTNTAFSATGGGTVVVTGTDNTLTTTTGTALNVANTTIGAAGLNFKSISAGTAGSAPANGIILNTTGSLGGLTVTGKGSTAQGGDGSGGIIQNATSHGISLNNTSNVSLTNMKINNPGAHGIDAANLGGTNLVANSTIIDWTLSTGNGVNLVNNNTNLTSFVIRGTTFNGTGTSNHGVFMQAQGTSIMKLSIDNSVFTEMLGDGVRVNGSITGSTGTVKVTITNSTFNNADPGGGNGGIALNLSGGMNFFADIENNTLDTLMRALSSLAAIRVSNGLTSNAHITIKGNTINNILGTHGIMMGGSGDSITTLLIDDNDIDRLGSGTNHGISVFLTDAAGDVPTADVTITNNRIGQAANLWTAGDGIGNGILLTTQNASVMRALISNNVVSANTESVEITRLRAIQSSTLNAIVTGNTLTDTSGTHVEFDASTGASGAVGGTINLSITGNVLPTAGVGVIKLTDNGAPGDLNVTQASSAEVSTANSNATVTVTGTPDFGQPTPPTPTLPTLP